MRTTKIGFFIDRVLHQEPVLSHLATVVQTSLNSYQTVRFRSNFDEEVKLCRALICRWRRSWRSSEKVKMRHIQTLHSFRN